MFKTENSVACTVAVITKLNLKHCDSPLRRSVKLCIIFCPRKIEIIWIYTQISQKNKKWNENLDKAWKFNDFSVISPKSQIFFSSNASVFHEDGICRKIVISNAFFLKRKNFLEKKNCQLVIQTAKNRIIIIKGCMESLTQTWSIFSFSHQSSASNCVQQFRHWPSQYALTNVYFSFAFFCQFNERLGKKFTFAFSFQRSEH